MAKFAVAAFVFAATIFSALSAPAPQFYAYQPTIASQSSNILRTAGNLGQISTYSKAIDTPTSSVRKSDIRISNDALAYPAASPLVTSYHAPVAVAAPVAYHAPVAAVHTPVATNTLLGVAYSSAPAVTHITFDGLGTHYAY